MSLTAMIANLTHRERMKMLSRELARNPAQAAMIAQLIIEQTRIELGEAEQGLETSRLLEPQ